jgi:hypothetical protein
MRIYSCWFDVSRLGDPKTWPASWYARHAAVLEHSARINTPGWTVQVRQIGPPPPLRAARGGNKSAYIYNTHKLADWRAVVDAAPDGEQLLLIDADTMILRPLDPVWDLDFDVAYTVKRDVTRLPINAGVIFLRVGPRARAFIAAWDEWNRRLLGDAALHDRFWKTYAGMNQAALGALLEIGGGPEIATLRELRCEEWNCESATWKTFDPENPPRIVHVKGAMRRGLMDPKKYPTALGSLDRQQIGTIWRDYEAAAATNEGA